MNAFRVLVTGSRSWPSRDAVWDRLWSVCAEHLPDGGTLTVVHGDCDTDDGTQGADAYAHMWCALMPPPTDITDIHVIEERHPADWGRTCDIRCFHRQRVKDGHPYCAMAGPIRNQAMVDLGAHLVLAFPLPESRGTWQCVSAARSAGLVVEVVEL